MTWKNKLYLYQYCPKVSMVADYMNTLLRDSDFTAFFCMIINLPNL